MANLQVQLNRRDVSKYVNKISVLSEYNDEGGFNAGVFRRGNFTLVLNNQTGLFNSNSTLFTRERENKEVRLFFQPEDERLDPVLVYTGYLVEASTSEDIGNKTIEFVFVDAFKFLELVTLEPEDVKAIDKRVAGDDPNKIKLNRAYIIAFLQYIVGKGALPVGFSVAVSLESIYPPSDAYYDLQTPNALEALNLLLQSTNSWALAVGSRLLINPRVRGGGGSLVKESDIINIDSLSDGYGKIYNQVRFNNQTRLYSNKSSINRYDSRLLEVSTYAAPSQALADSYLDYFAFPKKEASITLKMNPTTLFYNVGKSLRISIRENKAEDIKAFSLSCHVISKTLDFYNQIVIIRVRER